MVIVNVKKRGFWILTPPFFFFNLLLGWLVSGEPPDNYSVHLELSCAANLHCH